MQNDAPHYAPVAASDCADMGALRAAIDELDRHLVALLAVRQTYMERAAQLKPRRELVRDEARVEEVVSRVVAEAARVGLSPAIAEPVWRTLIERCIAHELEAFDRRAL
ncbi:MAG: chorismate mutase [Alphaproteobacteria bacterium 64-11]|nr:chorismate mutase [Alphaproteobacteria bacterium]OJU08181.1 MAG: chorismate mutase [Alphaproteobacteria bacterium 64-11]